MKYFEQVILVLGIWVLISPWILQFDSLSLALWNNIIVGVAIVLIIIWRMFNKEVSQ